LGLKERARSSFIAMYGSDKLLRIGSLDQNNRCEDYRSILIETTTFNWLKLSGQIVKHDWLNLGAIWEKSHRISNEQTLNI
jgi:hypothetical protein